MTSTAFGILRILFEQPFVGIALNIRFKGRPLLAVNKVDDQAPKLSGVLDLVLSFPKDDAEHASFRSQSLEDVPIVRLEVLTVECHEAWPVESHGNNRVLVPWRLGSFMCHFQKQQER